MRSQTDDILELIASPTGLPNPYPNNCKTSHQSSACDGLVIVAFLPCCFRIFSIY